MDGSLERKPWEMQDAEPAKAFGAFCVYRDLGVNRSLSKVVQKSGKSEGYRSQLGNLVEQVALGGASCGVGHSQRSAVARGT